MLYCLSYVECIKGGYVIYPPTTSKGGQMENIMLDCVIDDFMAISGLENEPCCLDHKDKEYHQAVDYLCKKIGYTIPDANDVAEAELRIPICQECVDALLSNEWIIFYCVDCNSSQWLCRKYSKRVYPPDVNIIALKTCPKCYGSLG